MSRMPIGRLAGIGAWTALATAWATVVIGKAAPPAAEAGPPVSQGPAPAAVQADTSTLPALPSMPESGLVIIRHTPAAPDEDRVVVQRVVVQQPAPAAPPVVSSRGS
jgi:hypothetical protein